MENELLHWGIFGVIITLLFAFDLGILHKKQRIIESRESILMCLFYVSIGLLFGLWVWYDLGGVKAAEYVTGFIVELSLSLDNIFIISVIFSSFSNTTKIPT
jgi:tellurite resistance protein TerC